MTTRAKILVEMALRQRNTSVEELRKRNSTERSSNVVEPIISKSNEIDGEVSDDSLPDFEPSQSSYCPSTSDTITEKENESVNLVENINELPLKRKLKPENWKRNIRKKNRAQGKQYIDTKGRVHPDRPLLQSPCLLKPNHINCNKIVEEDRKIIYSEFRNLCDIDSQRSFLRNLLEKVPKSRSTNSSNISRRHFTIKYSIITNNEKVSVCRNFFMATFNVTDALIRSSVNKVNDSGNLLKDGRGKHNKHHNKLSQEHEEFIISHIKSFPAVESHYCRKSSKKRYLDSTLNIKIMYNMYVTECETKIIKPISQAKYRKTFKLYNLGFFKPKKDQCKKCLCYRSLNENEKEVQREFFEKHIKAKEMARKERENDKIIAQNDATTLSFNFDLEAVLNIPKGPAGQIFYLRKLALYNLTTYNLGNQEVDCFLWDECQGKRGSNEISSCIYEFILCHSNISAVRMMSDGCGGQQKNSTFAIMCLKLLQNHPTLQNIQHKFFESGHTEMECDSIHSKIEKKSKNVPIYTPEGWAQIIRLSRNKPQPFNVKSLTFDDFYDFKSVTSNYILNIPWRKVCFLEYRKTFPKTIFYKINFDEQFVAVELGKKRGRNVNNINLEKAYSEELPISIPKYNDLKKMCNDLIIPKIHHKYFANIKTNKNSRDCLPQPDEEEESEYEN